MITLNANSRDRLNHQLRLWREELQVYGVNGTGESTMTQGDIDALEARINQLYENIELLNIEYRSIMEVQ